MLLATELWHLLFVDDAASLGRSLARATAGAAS
jgi:hypothetical protein